MKFLSSKFHLSSFFWQDLRNEVEKLRNEVNEREKALENRDESLLSASSRNLPRRDPAMRRAAESAGRMDLFQVPSLFCLLYLNLLTWRRFFFFLTLLQERLFNNKAGKNAYSLRSLCHLDLSHQKGKSGETEAHRREGTYFGSCDQ